MNAVSSIPAIGRVAESVLGPSIARGLTERLYRRAFVALRGWRNLNHGVFENYEEAARFCATLGTPARYALDHDWWARVQSSTKLHDYPVLWWMKQYGSPSTRVIDAGGSVGVSCYALSRLLPRGEHWSSWQVLELPEVVDAGRKLAVDRGADFLSFTDRWETLEGGGVLLCAGAAQYFAEDLFDSLARLRRLPRCVLVNRVPLHPTAQYVTLQNSGSAVAPCRVYRRDQFIERFERYGYVVLDEWECPQSTLRVPYHPELSVAAFSGICFALERPPGADRMS